MAPLTVSLLRLGLAALSSAVLVQLPAQTRTPITPELRPFVSVDAPVVALTHARLVDGTGAPVREDQTVILTGDRISAVGPSPSTAIPAEARVIDATGLTVLPGMVGLHEHSYFGGVQHVTQMSMSAPLLYLAFGVTTAMTAGSMLPYQELSMQQAVDQGRLPGPRFLITGPYLDGSATRSAFARALRTPEEVSRVVNYWIDEGVTWFKVLGGISRDLLWQVIRVAHARGAKVTGHLCSVTFAEAAALGIDALQHGFITASEYVPDKRPDECPSGNMRVQATVDVESAEVQASVRALAQRGTPVVSTLAVYETFTPERSILDTAAMAMLAPHVRREVEARYANRASGSLVVRETLLKKMMRWERSFVAAGGLLGAGSDPWGTGFVPGFGNVRNYELLLEAGFSPPEAVRILTLNGARILGLEQQIGSVEVGRQADLILVDGNPVAQPRDLYRIRTVFRAGRGYDAARLREAATGLIGVR
jgi:hypothetical protein